MKTYDKSLVEVWEWKEKVYQEMKDLQGKDFVEKVTEKANKTLKENNIVLDAVTLCDKQKV